MAIAVFAVFRAGGIACPINTRLNLREIADYAALCEPRFCLTDAPDLVKTLDLHGCWPVDALPRDLSAPPDQSRPHPEANAALPRPSGPTGHSTGLLVPHRPEERPGGK